MNPIVRMMKRYINTPLKYALPLLFIGALVLASTTGCVSNTPTASVSPTTSPLNSPRNSPSVAAPSTSARLDETFRNQGFVIVKPFTETKNQYNNIVYSGTIDDGDNVLQQYRHVLTIELVKDRSDALTRFNAYKTAAKASGDYTPNTINDTGWWHGFSEQRISSFYSVKDVNININEPREVVSFSRIFVTPVYATGITFYSYTISVDYATHK
jgi:hypothetical protein